MKSQLLKLEPWALYTHCYKHSLSLAVSDSVINVKLLRSNMDGYNL